MLEEFIGQADIRLDVGAAKRLKEIVEVLKERELLHGITPLKIRFILEDLGPTFVKLGQIISMRQDFLPEEYCNELMKLQSEVSPIPFETIIDVVEGEYKCQWQTIFSSIDRKTLGSASIAQVHRAELISGEKVVIKVQRPGIYDTMERDIMLLKRAVTVLNIVSDSGSVVDFSSIVTELWETAKQEMNFLMEADHIDEFRHVNADDPMIECPTVNRQLTTQRILVMDYVQGIPIDDKENLQKLQVNMSEIGTALGTHYVKQIIEDGFFHADPHPGNIWVRDNKIIWLDMGMMGRLSSRDRKNIRNAVIALVAHDTMDMKNAILALGMPKGRIDHVQLYDDVDALMNQYKDLDFASLQMGILIRQILNVLKNNNIAVPSGFSMFARGVLTIEGVLRKCCPEVSFTDIFTRSLELDFERNFSWLGELSRLKRESYVLMKKSMQLPEQISDILKMTLSGQTKVNLDLTGSEEPLKRIDKMINKMIMAIISAALLLGSSTICTTQMTPKIMEIPLLGFFGYLAAMILGSWLLWSIYKRD
ncbi:MAG: AarF/UbiB family protein [Selenomonadaceae bacterium]|nr:AarF/UbiB family protein [Selenomonadaceae bacterium]